MPGQTKRGKDRYCRVIQGTGLRKAHGSPRPTLCISEQIGSPRVPPKQTIISRAAATNPAVVGAVSERCHSGLDPGGGLTLTHFSGHP
jgi:hypothetical protein